MNEMAYHIQENPAAVSRAEVHAYWKRLERSMPQLGGGSGQPAAISQAETVAGMVEHSSGASEAKGFGLSKSA